MSQSYNFAALLEEAQKEGIAGGVLPDGTYTLLAKIAKVSNTQGGKDQIGVMWQVLDGPCAGQTTWENQTISPESPKAMAQFFGWCKRFGMDAAFFARQPQPTLPEIAAVIQDLQISATVGHRTWGKNNDRTDNTFKIISILGKAGAVPQAAAPAPVAAAPVAAAPVAVAPAPVAVAPVAPVAAPVAAVAPVAVAEALPVAPAVVAAPAAVAAPVAAVAEVPAPVAAIDPATGLPARTF